MKPKKIFVDLFYLNTAMTGIKTYMIEFCEAQKEYPNQNFEYIFSHDYLVQSESSFFKGDIPYWRKLWYHIYYFIWKQFILPLKVIKSGADILICFDFLGPIVPLPVKKLVVLHDAFFWQMPENYGKMWRKYFLQLIKFGLNGETIVITTSEYAKKSLLSDANIGKPIVVIYQCPKTISLAPSDEVMTRFGLKPQRYFLHIGTFDKRKLIANLVHSFSIIDSRYPGKFKLVLVGGRGISTTLDEYDQVLDEINKLGISQEVILTGFLPDDQVKSLYSHAFAYVFPSSNEGFGIPVIESMRHSLPLIISDQEALVEIAGNAALIHKTGSVVDLADKMGELVQNQELRDRLSQEGNNRSKLFTRKSFVDSFEKLFR